MSSFRIDILNIFANKLDGAAVYRVRETIELRQRKTPNFIQPQPRL